MLISGKTFLRFCLCLFYFSSFSKAVAQPIAGIRHIVVIGIDGLSSSGFKKAYTPCLDSLLRNGAYSYTVRSVLPSSSKPNWNAMLCGAGPEATGTVDESWVSGVTNFPYAALDEHQRFPNVFSVARRQLPNAELGAIYDWSGFGDLLNKNLLNYDAYCKTQKEASEKAAAYINLKKPSFLFIHFDDPDHLGHSIGFMSKEYTKSVEETDKDVKRVIHAINESGIADRTLIMVVSDHGGIANTHGGTSYEEMTTPIIFAGAGVRKNYAIQQNIYKYDIAASICFALGLKAPQAWTGRPVRAAFTAFNEPENIVSGAAVLHPPFFNTQTIFYPYGALFVDSDATVDIQLPADVKAEIRYTLDGSNPDKNSTLYTAPFKLKNSAIVTAASFEGNNRSTFVKAEYRVARPGVNSGLNYYVYHLDSLVTSLPDFDTMQPAFTGTCYDLGILPPENKTSETPVYEQMNYFTQGVGVRYAGWVQIDEDAIYNFALWNTGASKLYVNGELVVNNNNNAFQHRGNAGNIYLKKGYYHIQLDLYYNNKSNRLLLNSSYQWNQNPSRIIPPEKFFKTKPVN